ncbi:MAG: DUF305 domain-containing protein, partial [Actinobacteria bacterium]|nr:DUF305 domain-containing protein [Actinomycetota bacterium]
MGSMGSGLMGGMGSGQMDSGLMGGMDSGQMASMNSGLMGTMGSGEMGQMMADAQVDSEFAYLVKMIPHHEEAITAAQQLLARSDRPEMKAFATSIIDTQTAEADQMKADLANWYPGRDTTTDYTPMMRDLTQLSGDALDKAFLEDMIPHHGV